MTNVRRTLRNDELNKLYYSHLKKNQLVQLCGKPIAYRTFVRKPPGKLEENIEVDFIQTGRGFFMHPSST
jgi:hypothetical protein